MPTPSRLNTTIRLSEAEKKEILDLMAEYGYDQLSPFLRFAVRQLKRKR